MPVKVVSVKLPSEVLDLAEKAIQRQFASQPVNPPGSDQPTRVEEGPKWTLERWMKLQIVNHARQEDERELRDKYTQFLLDEE